MSTTTVTNETATERKVKEGAPLWQSILFWLAVIALVLVAFNLRLYELGFPFDRDGYDEGVYWQTLRAMSAGHPLYAQTFYSQPPFFMLSVYPVYALLGGTLWSARFGIVLVSLLALPGAFLLGKALCGRPGALALMLLIAIDPFYLAQSQTLQAEAPCVAFMLLAIGCAYSWWEHPEGITGIVLAALTGIATALSIWSKFFGFAALIPICLLILARLWQIARKVAPAQRLVALLPIAVGIVALALTSLLVLFPYLGAHHLLLADIVYFHTAANTVYQSAQANNLNVMRGLLTSIMAAAACYGMIVALLRGDWRVLPLIGWLLGSIYLLYDQVPLFHHHLVILIPPMAGLAVIGIGGKVAPLAFGPAVKNRTLVAKIAGGVALVLVLVAAGLNLQSDQTYFVNASTQSMNTQTRQDEQVATDLQRLISPNEQVITDAQFIAALANRDVPPSLVDTSLVRIQTGYLTTQQVIDAASSPRVHAVLFFTGRLQRLGGFHAWVARHFHLAYRYGSGQELWVR
ncbi:MAG TPA: glycosyltransferase family 39 protein [Ktedonobacteraceae bacterium]|nr:glycosyltransferase family 39 protein [Ktedonobacteraceae bacterium]